MDQVRAMYKISQILSKAFKEVNEVCAHSLADRAIDQEEVHQVKPVEKKVKDQKPKPVTNVQQEPQQKKQNKPQPKQNHSQKLAQKLKSAVLAQQDKPKPQQKQKSQKKGEEKHKAHPDRPKQPMTAFFIFSQEQKELVKKLHPNSSITELAKYMGQFWRGLDESDRAPYEQRANQLKVKYQKDLQKFYERHPEQKSKKQIKKEKAESKRQADNNEQQEAQQSPVQKPVSSNKPKKPTLIIEEQNSESV